MPDENWESTLEQFTGRQVLELLNDKSGLTFRELQLELGMLIENGYSNGRMDLFHCLVTLYEEDLISFDEISRFEKESRSGADRESYIYHVVQGATSVDLKIRTSERFRRLEIALDMQWKYKNHYRGPVAQKPKSLITETQNHFLQQLCNSFSLDELRTLMMLAGYDYDEIQSDTKSTFAREMSLYFVRRGQFERLRILCREQRPSFFW